ncbi:hypothetical protein FEE96_22920 [Parasedimentitalea maritima]|uniref:Uncharacterized protein n=1 Tax=Parasedimentitalea maritima TaxID=2578117 RepID=A0ABY2UND1_9RHOB|nr:hypothetical protein [Zongyanglinia marina]TLP55329.1 hypothetical protein FEE96_22920 [Zongyanglinia marina]
MMPIAENSFAVHPEWLVTMVPGITDKRLRSEIFEDEAFFKRLLSEQHPLLAFPDLQTEEKVKQITDVVSSAITEKNLRRIGLSWLAPRLILCLFTRETRTICGNLSVQDLDLVRKFHDHVDPSVIPTIPDVQSIEREGVHCFLAWAKGFPAPVAEHLKLLVSPISPQFSSNIEKRKMLFERFLRAVPEDDLS